MSQFWWQSACSVDLDHAARSLSLSGATAFAKNAGVIGLLASILVWIGSYAAYL